MVCLLNTCLMLYNIFFLLNGFFTYYINKKQSQIKLICNSNTLIFFLITNVFIFFYNNSFGFYIITLLLGFLILHKTFTKSYITINLINLSIVFMINLFFIKYSSLNLIVGFEIINILLVCTLLIHPSIYNFYKKTVYMVLITTNLLILSFFILNYLFILNYIQCNDFYTGLFLFEHLNKNYITVITYIIILIKLGLFFGPKYNIYLYSTLSNINLTVYMYFYYIIFILFSIKFFNIVLFTPTLFLLVMLGIFFTNKKFIVNQNKLKMLFYWSNQISLIYLMFLYL